jgi:hypothetical protein
LKKHYMKCHSLFQTKSPTYWISRRVLDSWKKLQKIPLTIYPHRRVNFVGNMKINHLRNYKWYFCWWYAIHIDGNTNRVMPVVFFLFGMFFVCKSMHPWLYYQQNYQRNRNCWQYIFSQIVIICDSVNESIFNRINV